MRRWEDEKMWRCEDEQMRRSEDEKMWRLRRCEEEKMWRWEDEKMRRCEDEKMWRWENEKMLRWEDVLQTPTIGRTLRSDALGEKELRFPQMMDDENYLQQIQRWELITFNESRDNAECPWLFGGKKPESIIMFWIWWACDWGRPHKPTGWLMAGPSCNQYWFLFNHFSHLRKPWT